MNLDQPLPDRLKASGTDIEQRAVELAQIDGRESFTDADLARAAAEPAGSVSTPLAPEVVVPAICFVVFLIFAIVTFLKKK